MKQPKEIDKSKLPYRTGALAIVIDKDNQFLLVQLKLYANHQWNFVGGGREKEDKDAVDNIFRELKEELSLTKDLFEIIGISNHPITYDFPDEMILQNRKVGKNYRGQKKDVVVLRFLGEKT